MRGVSPLAARSPSGARPDRLPEVSYQNLEPPAPGCSCERTSAQRVNLDDIGAAARAGQRQPNLIRGATGVGDIQVILHLRVRAHMQEQARAGGRPKYGSEH